MSEFNKLKSVSIDNIENAISKALTELTGVEYQCSISNIEYEVIEGANFEVSVSNKIDWSFQNNIKVSPAGKKTG